MFRCLYFFSDFFSGIQNHFVEISIFFFFQVFYNDFGLKSFDLKQVLDLTKKVTFFILREQFPFISINILDFQIPMGEIIGDTHTIHVGLSICF